ncbi:hypothetical protein GGF43_005656, partial [Coemansia sp. RSA 2618]
GPFGGGGRPSHPSQSQFGRPGGHTGQGGGSGDMVTKVLGKIMGGLFKGSGSRTRDLEFDGADDDVLSGFDDSSAVQRVVAEHYYRHVYHKNMDLRQTTPQTLGGAAAIKALRSERRMVQQLRHSDLAIPHDLHHDQMVMGLALSEAGELLERKAALGPLRPEDNMEAIGGIALATIIKIKIDEENGEYDARAQSTGAPAHRSSSRRNRRYDYDHDQSHRRHDYENDQGHHRRHDYENDQSHHRHNYEHDQSHRRHDYNSDPSRRRNEYESDQYNHQHSSGNEHSREQSRHRYRSSTDPARAQHASSSRRVPHGSSTHGPSSGRSNHDHELPQDPYAQRTRSSNGNRTSVGRHKSVSATN